ncbi:MAG: hypothetical protein JJE39_13095 [Vicinamibacteria bacterium]|nr:hypothetical protein [Vicinamibacteria bacterium]
MEWSEIGVGGWMMTRGIRQARIGRSKAQRAAKGKASLLIYAVAIGVASFSSALAGGLYAFVALMWLIPDRRIERVLAE